MTALMRSITSLVMLAATSAAMADAWPPFQAPPEADVETVAADMLLNGKQCRMVRFEVHATEDEVMTFYRAQFGRQHVENQVKDDRVIATRQGDYFVTVQLHSLDSRTVQGTVMTTLMAGRSEASAVLVDTKRLFPADTQVVSTMQTGDAAKRSLMVIGVNRNSVRANRDHVVDTLAERGFRLTKQGGSSDDRNATSMSLQLASPSEEASVTISDFGAYRSVVINRIQDGK